MTRTLLIPMTAAVVACVLILSASGGATAGVDTVDEVAIDVDVTGNDDSVLGPTEFCNADPLEVGETIEVDVVVRGVPEYVPRTGNGGVGDRGLRAIGLELLVDPDIARVQRVHGFDGPTLIASDNTLEPLEWFDYGDPARTRIDLLDLAPTAESGDGVLVRVTLEAMSPGVSTVGLSDSFTGGFPVGLLAFDAPGSPVPYRIESAFLATIVVGEANDCPASAPTITPTLAPSPTRRPTPTLMVDFTPSPTPTLTPGLTRSPTPTRSGTPAPGTPSLGPPITPKVTPRITPAAAPQFTPTPTAAASPTSAPTPLEFPRAGAAPRSGDGGGWVVVVGLLLLAGGAVVAASLRRIRR